MNRRGLIPILLVIAVAIVVALGIVLLFKTDNSVDDFSKTGLLFENQKKESNVKARLFFWLKTPPLPSSSPEKRIPSPSPIPTQSPPGGNYSVKCPAGEVAIYEGGIFAGCEKPATTSDY